MVEYRLWEGDTLLGYTEQQDSPSGYSTGMAYVHSLSAMQDFVDEELWMSTELRVQIVLDGIDVTGSYGHGWEL